MTDHELNAKAAELIGYAAQRQGRDWNPCERIEQAWMVQALAMERNPKGYIKALEGRANWLELAGLHGCYWYKADGAFATPRSRVVAAVAALGGET